MLDKIERVVAAMPELSGAAVVKVAQLLADEQRQKDELNKEIARLESHKCSIAKERDANLRRANDAEDRLVTVEAALDAYKAQLAEQAASTAYVSDSSAFEQVFRDVHHLRHEVGWDMDPDQRKRSLNRLKYLATEVVELTDAVMEPSTSKEEVAAEIYDVVWNAFSVASMVGLDAASLQSAFDAKRRHNEERIAFFKLTGKWGNKQ